MKKNVLVTLALALCLCGFAAGGKEASYPERDITFVIPFGQGGGTDVWGRKVADGMAKELKTNVVATNVTGGSAGSIGVAQVWSAKHDGYTLCGTSETPLTIPVMTPITQTSKDWEYFIAAVSPGFLAINAAKAKSLNINTITDLANYANKSSLKIAGTTGGLWFALASLLTSDTYGKWPFTWVSYGGSGPAITACVGGIDADLVVASAGEMDQYLKSGQLKVLANMDKTAYSYNGASVTPITSVIPAIAKYLPLRQWLGFKVPADVGKDVLDKLTKAFNNVVKSEDIKKFAGEQVAEVFAKSGAEAKAMAQASEAALCWILSDLGKTTYSPTERGIKKPE